MLIFLGFFAPVLLAATANSETRKLKLYYLHTGERTTIAFKKNGKFLPAGLKKINYFLRDWRRNEPTKMDPLLLDLVWEIYRQSGSKAYITVISGYRSPATNNVLRKRGRGVAKRSQHTLGKALDFFLPDVKLAKLRKIGLIKQVGGVGYYPRSGSPFVHIDTGSVRHWPRMTRKELVRVFPSGKTLHIPADGKPLPGYNQAVASYNARKSSSNKIVLAKGTDKERKSFFQRLASLANDEEDDSKFNNVPAPRKVRTTSKPVSAKPVPTPEIPPKPDLPLIASVPVPRIAPRYSALAPGDVIPANIAVARLGSQNEIPAFNIPVPAIRPEFTPLLVAQADIARQPAQPTSINNNQPAPSELRLASTASEQLRARLIAQAKDQLRNQLAAPLRPLPALGSSFETALLPQQKDAAASNNPVLTRSMAAAIPAAANPVNTHPIDKYTKSGENDPVMIIPVRRPQFFAASSDIARNAGLVLAYVESDADNLASPENLRAMMEKQSRELAAMNAAIDDTLQIEDSISPLILAAIPVPSTRQSGIKQAAVSVSGDHASPASRETQIVIASLENTSSENSGSRPDAVTLTSAPKPLDELSLGWYEQNRTGKFVLATSLTIEAVDEMRAPAYGRAAIRQSPKTVLTAGFTPSGSIQNSSSFTGQAIRFQSFTKFN